MPVKSVKFSNFFKMYWRQNINRLFIETLPYAQTVIIIECRAWNSAEIRFTSPIWVCDLSSLNHRLTLSEKNSSATMHPQSSSPLLNHEEKSKCLQDAYNSFRSLTDSSIPSFIFFIFFIPWYWRTLILTNGWSQLSLDSTALVAGR